MKRKIKSILFLALLSPFLSHCTHDEPPSLSLDQYNEQAELMIKITDKLLHESDANLMHKAADGIQKARVVTCQTVTEECSYYGKFLSKAISISSDQKLTLDEIKELVDLQLKLKSEIEKGKELIKKNSHKSNTPR